MSIREDLKAYLDDELTPERALEVKAAIDQDPALREEYLFMKQLSGDIKSAANEPQIKGLDKATARAAKPGFQFALPKWALYGTASLAAVFVIGLVGSKLPMADAIVGKSLGAQEEVSATAASPMLQEKAKSMQDEAKMSLKGQDMEGDSLRADSRFGNGGFAGKKSPTFDARNSVSEYEYSPERPTTEAGGGAAANTSSAADKIRDRKVIRTAQMGLKVKDVSKAMTETENQVAAMGGFVENTNFNQAEDASKGTMNFQVPEKNFDAIVEYLGKAGTIISNRKTGTDVTGEIAYTDGRIISLADEELNLIKELQRTKDSSVRLEIRGRLSNVRQQMRGLKEENQATKNLAEMSRFVVNFEKAGQFDAVNPDDWFGQTTNGAGNVLGFFGRIFGVGLIYTVILAPVWLPIVGIVWYLRRKARMNTGA